VKKKVVSISYSHEVGRLPMKVADISRRLTT